MLETGRVCIKTAGREAGRACVVIDTIDETYVMVTGPKSLTKVRRRKCNIAHLEPLEFQLKLAKNAADNEVARLLQAEKILEKFSPGKPITKLERPKVEKAEGKALEKEKKGLRERLLGRAKKEEKPKEEKKPEKPGEKKPEKPKEKPKKEKPKPKEPAKEKPKKAGKPARAPKKPAKKKK